MKIPQMLNAQPIAIFLQHLIVQNAIFSNVKI